MPQLDAPSPTPSNMPPPPNHKRPRQSNMSTTATLPPRAKWRKAEGSADQESAVGDWEKGGRSMNFGVGMVKGREEEWGEPRDVQTKIDFNKLPVETLYRYLEYYDMLPRWDVSPWSEDPCTPPSALYTIPPTTATIPLDPSPPSLPAEPPISPHEPTPPDSQTVPEPTPTELDSLPDEEPPAPPTTRSKTAPNRRPLTPPLPSPPAEIKRGVITLSDVLASREVLAEKANTHWVKGLGGGQNKEGETIVNFLYKMKVGHGRLLRVYNPTAGGLA